MASFTHPNVMSLLGLCYEEEMPLLIMPFMSGGNVLKYVRQNKETLYLDQDTANVTQVRIIYIIYLLGVCYPSNKVFWRLYLVYYVTRFGVRFMH